MRETGTGKRILTVVSVLAIVCGTLVWKTRGAGGADAASPIPIEERTTSGHNAVTEIASSPTRSALALSGLTVDRDGTRIHGVQVRVSLAGETHGVTSDGDGQFVVSFGSGRSGEIEVHCEDPSGAHEPCTAILQAHDWGAMHTFTLERREAVLLKVMDRASGEPVLRYGIRWSTDVLKLALGGPEGATPGKPVVENAGLHEGGMIRLPVSMVGARARIIPEDTTYAVSEVVLVEKSALAAPLVVPLDRKATVVVDVEGPAQLRGREVVVRLLKTFGIPGPIEQIVPVEASTSLFAAAARLGGFFEEWEVATTTVGASTKLHGPLGGSGFCVVAKCGTSANAERVALAPLVDPTRVRILFGSGARILGSLTPKEVVTDPHTFDCVEFGPPAWRRAGIVVAKVDPSDGSLTWLPKLDFQAVHFDIDGNARFEISDLAPGTWEVHLSWLAHGSSKSVHIGTVVGPQPGEDRRVEFDVGRSLPIPFSAIVRLDGEPLPAGTAVTWIRLEEVRSGRRRCEYQLQTGAEGKVAARLVPGRYVAGVRVDADLSNLPVWTWSDAVIEVGAAGGAAVTIEARTWRAEVALVVAGTERRLAGARATIDWGEIEVASTVAADEHGVLRIPSVPRGEFTVRIEPPDAQAAAVRLGPMRWRRDAVPLRLEVPVK